MTTRTTAEIEFTLAAASPHMSHPVLGMRRWARARLGALWLFERVHGRDPDPDRTRMSDDGILLSMRAGHLWLDVFWPASGGVQAAHNKTRLTTIPEAIALSGRDA